MKIGFIDYYLDEWHANNYPSMIAKASNGDMQVEYAWGKIASPKRGTTTEQWCEKFGVTRCGSIEEVIVRSDALVVLSPDNCEMHEELCALPLTCKKPVYVDKAFAPDADTAKRIFAVAENSGTPCWSSSALRFASEYKDVSREGIRAVSCWGPNNYEIYAIHLLEPLTMFMGTSAARVMVAGDDSFRTMLIEMRDGRLASVSLFANGSPFVTQIARVKGGAGENSFLEIKSDYFGAFIAELVDFFRTGEEKVPHDQTVAIMALRAAGQRAMQTPGEWIDI